MKRELYLRVLLKNHLLPDIPCPNFSGLNVFFFLLSAKKMIPQIGKKRSNFSCKIYSTVDTGVLYANSLNRTY